jgi:hypothetical protein
VSNWNHVVCEKLAVLRLPPEREIEIVEEARLRKVTVGGYYPAVFSALDCISKISISTLLLSPHISCAIIPIISP